MGSTLFVQNILAYVMDHTAVIDVDLVHIPLVVEVVEDIARSVGKGESITIHQGNPTVFQRKVVVDVYGRGRKATDGDFRTIVVNYDLNANSVITDATVANLVVNAFIVIHTT